MNESFYLWLLYVFEATFDGKRKPGPETGSSFCSENARKRETEAALALKLAPVPSGQSGRCCEILFDLIELACHALVFGLAGIECRGLRGSRRAPDANRGAILAHGAGRPR